MAAATSAPTARCPPKRDNEKGAKPPILVLLEGSALSLPQPARGNRHWYKKVPPPTSEGYEGRLFPPERSMNKMILRRLQEEIPRNLFSRAFLTKKVVSGDPLNSGPGFTIRRRGHALPRAFQASSILTTPLFLS
jgi:hypothetical protein